LPDRRVRWKRDLATLKTIQADYTPIEKQAGSIKKTSGEISQ
jgi:hypothetical protein